MRYEPDTKHLYLTANAFKKFCVERQTNYKETLQALGVSKIFLETVNKRMSKGMKIVSPPVRALKFDVRDFDLGIETVLKQQDES
jgi:hypothetical protein